jgi:hypothetical protein
VCLLVFAPLVSNKENIAPSLLIVDSVPSTIGSEMSPSALCHEEDIDF